MCGKYSSRRSHDYAPQRCSYLQHLSSLCSYRQHIASRLFTRAAYGLLVIHIFPCLHQSCEIILLSLNHMERKQMWEVTEGGQLCRINTASGKHPHQGSIRKKERVAWNNEMGLMIRIQWCFVMKAGHHDTVCGYGASLLYLFILLPVLHHFGICV